MYEIKEINDILLFKETLMRHFNGKVLLLRSFDKIEKLICPFGRQVPIKKPV